MTLWHYSLFVSLRLMVIGLLTPLLSKIGYPISWKQSLVITWGGLRGAVGLSLALVVLQTPGIPLDTIGSKVCSYQMIPRECLTNYQ